MLDITVSQHSQKLIKKYFLACGVSRLDILPVSSINLTTLRSWLAKEHINHSNQSQKDPKIEFALVSLQAQLLEDLCNSMKGNKVDISKKNNDVSQMSKIKFILLIISGFLVTACQGFDGIITMISVLSLSQAIMLGAGVAFTILCLVVFCGVDLVKVANTLGIKLGESYKLLDAYLLQLQKIKAIRKKINNYNILDMSQQELQQMEEMLSMLQNRLMSLAENSKQFNEALNSNKVFIVKTLISGVSCVLHFGTGFFVGESVALFIAPIVLNPAIPAFWPVLIFSTIIGLASLSVYWIVERPDLKKLVSNWFGLNEDDVQKLSEDLLDKEVIKLACLKEKIIKTSKLTQRLTQLEVRVDEQPLANEATHHQTVHKLQVGNNFYSFLKSPGSLKATSSEEQELDKATSCCAM